MIEALRSEREINKIWIAEGSQDVVKCSKLLQLAKEANVIVQFVPKKKIDQMADGNHQGVVASSSCLSICGNR